MHTPERPSFVVPKMLFFKGFFGFSHSYNSIHFVINYHKAFINTHTGFRKNLDRLGSHSTMNAYLCTAVGFVACTTLISADTLFFAVQDRFNCIVDSTKVRSLYLYHMSCFIISKINRRNFTYIFGYKNRSEFSVARRKRDI